MIVKVKKRTLFFIGLLLTSVFSLITGLRTSFLKDESMLVTTAHADTPAAQCGTCGCPWTELQCVSWDAGGGGCLSAGTLVDTPSGGKAIEDLIVGDAVYGYLASTGERVTSIVTATMKHDWEEVKERSPLLIITHQKGVLRVTANHWIYRKNDRQGEYANFDRAGTLKVGDIFTMEDGEESEILKIEDGPEYDFVYDITVEGVHTYFANGVMVHNTDGGGGGDGGGCCK